MTIPAELTVRVQPLQRGAGACPATRRWPLRTLVAYLFEGRECAAVRALLARGAGVAHGSRLTWPPVELTGEQLSAIERTFPQGAPDEPLRASDAAAIALVIPAAASGEDGRGAHLAVSLRAGSPLAVAAAERARHIWFDYGAWADLHDATVSAEEAMAVLRAARRQGGEGEGEEDAEEVAERFAPERAFVRYMVPRPGETPPWSEG